MGDLKDRLGIKHRRDMQKAEQFDMEQTPIFHQPHFRSDSEISTIHQDYELTVQRASQSPPQTTPLMQSPYSNQSSPSHSPYPDRADELAPYQDRELLSPQSGAQNIASSPTTSFVRASYYSASDIPAPSPTSLVQPSYNPLVGRSPTNPPMSAISYDPVSTYVQSTPSGFSGYQYGSPSASASPGRAPTSPTRQAEAFEMHVRAPSEEWRKPSTPTPEQAHVRDPRFSVASSYSVYDGIVEEPSSPSQQQKQQQSHESGPWQAYSYDPSEPHAL